MEKEYIKSKNYKNILFDLDGTLTDPGIGITNSFMYALESFGIHENDRTALYKVIGPPLLDSFRDFYGFSDEMATEGMKKYREYYENKGMLENELYDGIPEMLESLREKGLNLYVATSKPEVYAVKILEYFNIDRYFTLICGSDFEEKRSKKELVIQYALSKTDRKPSVMIGDRKYDCLGARENGIDSIGVLYGYGSYEELKDAGAVCIVKNVQELGGLF